MDFAGTTDPVAAYEAMTQIAQTAYEVGFASVWLIDHVAMLPQPSQEAAFEACTTIVAVARYPTGKIVAAGPRDDFGALARRFIPLPGHQVNQDETVAGVHLERWGAKAPCQCQA